MPVAGTVHSRANTSALLKTIFDDDLQSTIQNETPFLKYAQKKDFPLDGSDFTIGVHVKRNASTQATLIDNDLPDSGQSVFVQGTLRAARLFHPFQIDNELLKLADRAPATFSERCEAIYTDAKQSMLKDGERQLLGDQSGVINTVATYAGGGTATATFTVLTTPAAVAQGVEDTRFLEEGMQFSVWPAALANNPRNGTMSAGEEVGPWFQVASINDDGITFTATMSDGSNAPAGVVANDVIIRKRNAYRLGGAGDRLSKEVNGMALISSSTVDFMGIPVATNRRWRGVPLDAGGDPFSASILTRAIIKGRQFSAMKDHPNVAYCHPAQTFALVYGGAGTYPDIRYTRDNVNKYGTTSKPVFNIDGKDVTLETCLDMQKSRMYLFKDDALLYGELQSPQLEDFGDISILPATNTATGGTVAAQKGWFSWRLQMGCLRRNAFVNITNLAVPAGL